MSHPLQTKVASLSRRAHRLVSAHAASRILAITLGSVVVLAGLDSLFHYRDRGLRIICTAILLAAVTWAVYRFLLPLLRWRQNDLATARHVERRFPLLGQRLSSALQFLCEDEDDPKAGSSALRRAVIVEATAQVEPLELDDVLDRRPIWRALAAAAAVCVVAVLAWSSDPAAARMGTMRLLNPLGDVVWPRETRLEFLTPVTQVAVGESFEVALVNRNGALPRDVQIHFRQQADGRILTQDALPIVGGKMIVRRENVHEPFEYRAQGGDDLAMPWIAVAVVEPPRAEVPRVTIVPPAYTHWPPRPSEASIHGLRGSRVELQARVDRPLRSAAVVLEGGRRIQAALSRDGTAFSVSSSQSEPWTIAGDRAYWFELVDRDDESLIGGSLSKWEIRPITDNRPTVDLQLPSAANVYVTRDAVVAVRVVVQDDLAIRDATLAFTLSDPSDQQASPPEPGPPRRSIALYEGPAEEARRKKGKGAAGQMLTLEYAWEISKLDLHAGMQIEYRAAASDYQPASGESPLRRLLIITNDQLESRIADRQSTIVAELARALKIERQSRAQVASLEIQLRQIGQLNKADVDRLQAARLAQRQATRILTAEGEGLAFQINAMLDELRTNRIESRETAGRLSTLAAGIKALSDGPLPRIEHQLDQALSGAQARLGQSPQTPTPQADKHIAAAVGAAGEEQDRVIGSLESMLKEWSQWDNYRRLARDLTEVLRQQQALRRGAETLGRDPRAIGRRTDELTPQQQADLLKLSHRQLALSRRLDATETRMEQLIETLGGERAASAGVITEALDLSRAKTTSGQMRQSARRIEENRIGQAQTVQRQILGDLQETLDVLLGRGEQNLARRMREQMTELSNALSALITRQSTLITKTRRLETDRGTIGPSAPRERVDRLAAEQIAIGTDLRGAANQLTLSAVFQLALQDTSDDIDRVVRLLRKSETGLQTIKAQQRALRQMTRIVEAIKPQPPDNPTPADDAADPKAADTDPAKAGGGKIKTVEELALLLAMQCDVNRRTMALEKSRAKSGELTEQEKIEFDRLSQQQGRLADLFGQPTDQPQPNVEDETDENLNELPPDPNDTPPGSLDDQLPGNLSDDLLDPLDPPQAGDAPKPTDKTDDPAPDENPPSDEEKTSAQLIANGMRRSERLVGQRDSGEETKKVQQQIVERLEEIMRQARRRSKKPGGGSNKPQPRPQQGDKRSKGDTNGEAGDPNDNRAPREGSDQAGHRPNDLADIGRLRSLLDGPWGKLPEKERQAKIQGFRDQFLPQYEIDIERYYQRLIRQQEHSP